MKNVFKLKKGITLIALVITIIVLLILAGISISMLSGDNGILQKATDVKTNSNNAQIKERLQLAYHSALTGGQGSYTKDNLEEELEKEFGENNYNVDDSDNTNWILSAKGQDVTIPAGKATEIGKLASEIFESDGTTEGKMHIGDYVNYPVYYDNVSSYEYYTGEEFIPADEYIGWRVLSIEGTGDTSYIKLVSAGCPINYKAGYGSCYVDTNNLTKNFFSTPINSNNIESNFYQCGLKTGINGTLINNISEAMNLFDNKYTAKYTNEENDVDLNAIGKPKVQSITTDDFSKVLEGTASNVVIREDHLLAIPCKNKDSIYVPTHIAGYDAGGDGLDTVWTNGQWWNSDGDFTEGIRCTVCLTFDCMFSLTNGSNPTDTVKTWDLV